MNTYVDINGVENVAVGIVKQARKDFIKGGKILYGVLKKIPTHKELMSDPIHLSLSNDSDVRWMYDAWRFVRDDPYQFFGDVGEERTIKAWIKDTICEYYKAFYLTGATILFHKHTPRNEIKDGDEKELSKIIDDDQITRDFIEARDYIKGLNNHDAILREWNIAAYGRSKKFGGRKHIGKSKINETDYVKEASKKKQKNIAKAKELYESGISAKAIAKELGVEYSTVRNYLRS